MARGRCSSSGGQRHASCDPERNGDILVLVRGSRDWFVVATVAKWRRSRYFAPTEEDLSRLSRLVSYGCEFGTLMRTIAKWLLFAKTTRTPEIGFARFNLNWERGICCSGGFAHSLISLLGIDKRRYEIQV